LENLRAWCAKWTDGHSDSEIQRTLRTAQQKRYRYKGVTMGKKLGATAEEVSRYQLQTIYAATETPEEAVERQRARRAEVERERRRANGAKSHAESAERLKPWVALGIQRRAYYHWKQTGKLGCTNSCPLHLVSSAAEASRDGTGEGGARVEQARRLGLR
jgi:hypothetical protein